MPPPFKRKPKAPLSLVSSDGTFEAIPNGHRKFLTKSGLARINQGRTAGNRELLSSSRRLSDSRRNEEEKEEARRRRFLGAERELKNPGEEDFPGQNVSIETTTASISPREHGENDTDDHRRHLTVEDWIKGFDDENRSSAIKIDDTGGDLYDYDDDDGFDPSSTTLPEVPTVFGDTVDGEIMTMRLKAFKGNSISVRAGDTIKLVESPVRAGGFVASLEVVEIIYGENAYPNLLVEGINGGGCEEEGRKRRKKQWKESSTCTSTAYARVIRNPSSGYY